MTQSELAPIVQTRQLRKAYQMGSQKVVALAGVDVDIPANSFTVIMGRVVLVKALCCICLAVGQANFGQH
jgi:hypothetical protein